MITWPEAFMYVGCTFGFAAIVIAFGWGLAKVEVARANASAIFTPPERSRDMWWSYTGPIPETPKAAAPTKGAAAKQNDEGAEATVEAGSGSSASLPKP